MSPDDSISIWLSQMKQGDRRQFGQLFDRYFKRAAGLAAARLRGRPNLNGMEEDVALSALKSLCIGAERGRFPDLSDRDGLWNLLAVITVRKALKVKRRNDMEHESLHESIVASLGKDPSPEQALEISDTVEKLLDLLEDSEMKQIAIWKVEGFTNEEIAQKLGRVVRTVERKLHRIRQLWQKSSAESSVIND